MFGHFLNANRAETLASCSQMLRVHWEEPALLADLLLSAGNIFVLRLVGLQIGSPMGA